MWASPRQVPTWSHPTLHRHRALTLMWRRPSGWRVSGVQKLRRRACLTIRSCLVAVSSRLPSRHGGRQQPSGNRPHGALLPTTRARSRWGREVLQGFFARTAASVLEGMTSRLQHAPRHLTLVLLRQLRLHRVGSQATLPLQRQRSLIWMLAAKQLARKHSSELCMSAYAAVPPPAVVLVVQPPLLPLPVLPLLHQVPQDQRCVPV
mmetsp:Transcript_66367/g.158790  ORF Transcript_66367/g.158790 Transcript_66367/m.158790 type:complete len:206 (-) Transcript_66367:776-1393(-)